MTAYWVVLGTDLLYKTIMRGNNTPEVLYIRDVGKIFSEGSYGWTGA